MQTIATVSTHLNAFTNWYLTLTILFNVNHSFADNEVLLFITNYSIQHYSFICTQLNGSKYCYVSLTIQLNINHLFTQSEDQTVLFQTIQFSLSHLFALSLNFKEFYLTLSGAVTQVKVNLGAMAMKKYSIFPKLQHYWSLIIRLLLSYQRYSGLEW